MVEQSHPNLFTDDPARSETVIAEAVSFESFLPEYGLFDPLRRDAVICEPGTQGRYHVRPR